MVTLETIRDPGAGESYPCDLLTDCETALVLFAAAFLGRQDAYWIADAGLEGTCVDLDRGRLAEMSDAYPDGWEFVVDDAFFYATLVRRHWDVVSIDCPTNLFDRCAEWLPVWCSLVRKAVVLGCGESTNVVAPDGWALTDLRYRSSFSGGVYWAVLEPR